MRSKAEIGRGCEENGYIKGTKGYDDCIKQIQRYEKQAEADLKQEQKEEAERKLRNRG